MVFKWLLSLLLVLLLIQNVGGQPGVPSPIQVLVTCMSILHVMSDQHAHPDHVLWQSTAHIMYVRLYEHVTDTQYEILHQMQHAVETHVWFSYLEHPHMKAHWFTQAATCQHALVHIMSDPT